jgi:hypothetical protein
MDIKQAKKLITNISKSTGTKHHKVLIGELCTVIKFLLDEIERIKLPPMIVLKQSPDLDPMKPIGPPPPPPSPMDPLILPPEIAKPNLGPYRTKILPQPRQFGSTDDPNPQPFETTDNQYPFAPNTDGSTTKPAPKPTWPDHRSPPPFDPLKKSRKGNVGDAT